MKNFRKVIALVLAVAMMLSTFTTSFAAEKTSAEKLNDLGLLSGITASELEKTLSREVGITMVLKALGYTQADADAAAATTAFTDTPGWVKGWAALAAAKGITSGKTTTTFAPADTMSEKEFVTFMLRAIGYDSAASWTDTAALAASSGLSATLADATFVKSDAAAVMFNALSAAVAGGTGVKLIDQLITDKVVTQAAAVAAALVPAAVVTAVSAIDATTIKVTFDNAVTTAAADYAVVDSKAVAVAVSSVTTADAGKVAVLKVAAMTVGAKYTVTFGAVSMDVVPTTTNDETKPALASAVAVTGTLVRATFETRNINQDTLVAANFTLDNSATVSAVTLDTVEMAKDANANNTVLLLNVTGLSAGKAFKLTSKLVASYEAAVATTSEATFAGKDADVKAPVVAGAASVAGYKVLVTFTEDALLDVASATDIANYTITPALAISKAEIKKNEVGGDTTVTLYTADQKAGTAYTVKVDKVSDGTNVMKAAESVVFAGLDKVLNQTVTSAVATDATKVLVTFGYEANDTALVAANYTLNNSVTVTSAAFKADTTEADGLDQTKVILTTSAMKAGTAYTLTVGVAVQDSLAQGLKEVATKTFAGMDADTTFGSVAAVAADKNTITVTFGDEVDRVTATTLANYSISDLGYPSSVTLDSTNKIATLKVATQTAGKAYTITLNNIKDDAANVITAATKVTFTGKGDVVDRLKITGVTAVTTTAIKVSFNQALLGDGNLDETAFALTSGSDVLTFPAGAIATDGNDYVILTVGTTALSASKVYTFTMAITSDLAGKNTAHTFATTAEADRKATFVGTDSTTMTFAATSITAVDKTHIKVTFDTALNITEGATDAGVLTLYTDSALTTGAIASLAATTLSVDKKTAIFEMASALADSSVYYAKLLRLHDAGAPESFDTVDGAVLAVETDLAYKKLTLVTGTLTAAASVVLDITSATMMDVNKLQVVFNQDLVVGSVAEADFDIALTSTGASIETVTNVESVDARTYDVYFTIPTASLTNTNGVYYLKVGSVNSLVTGVAIAFDTDKSFESFAYNAAENAKPTITMVEPLTATRIKVTTSEKVFSTNDSTTQLVAASLVIRNQTDSTLLTATTDYTVTASAVAAEVNTVFYVDAVDGQFITGGSYYIGFAANVYGIDEVVAADVYAGTSTTTNGFNFGGLATMAAPVVANLGFNNIAGEQVNITTAAIPSVYRTLQVVTDTVVPTAATAADYTFDLSAGAGTVGLHNLVAADDTSDALDTVYYRLVDAAGNKTAWVADGTIDAITAVTLTFGVVGAQDSVKANTVAGLAADTYVLTTAGGDNTVATATVVVTAATTNAVANFGASVAGITANNGSVTVYVTDTNGNISAVLAAGSVTVE